MGFLYQNNMPKVKPTSYINWSFMSKNLKRVIFGLSARFAELGQIWTFMDNFLTVLMQELLDKIKVFTSL